MPEATRAQPNAAVHQHGSTTMQVRRELMPLADVMMELRDFRRAEAAQAGAGGALATARLVFTTGAGVVRYDWLRERRYIERLAVEDGAVRLERLRRGAPLLNTHSAWELEDQIGVVEDPQIADGIGECAATFSRRPSVAGYVQDVEDRIIRNVSVGYVRHRVEMVPPAQEGGLWEYRVVEWEPYEVSLVPIPADMDSQVRAAGSSGASGDHRHDVRMFECEFIDRSTPAAGIQAEESPQPQEIAMPGNTAGGAAAASAEEQRTAASPATATHTAPAVTQAGADVVAQAQQRAAAVVQLCQRAGHPGLAADFVARGLTVEQAGLAIVEHRAAADEAAGGARRNLVVHTVTDEAATRMAGIEEAVLHRVDPRVKLTDNGRQYRGMTLLELGRDMLERAGVNTRGMDRMTLATRMLQLRSGGMGVSSDFGSITANVANKRMRGAYDENPGTYSRWARRAPNAPDFKSISVVQLGAMPDLLKVNEHGEFKYGSFSDGAETYQLLTYGRMVSLSRPAIVNDDLRAFDRLVTGFGNSAARLENRTVYAQVTGNPAMADSVALFHATHANLGTGAGSALQFSSLTAARTAMRVQKGLNSEELNLAPAYLLVPAALEQTAYQLTSSNYVPATKGEVNEFRAGGRTAVEPVVEPILDAVSATAWYAIASSTQVDTVEYCWLDGAEGPVIESEVGFEIDGITLKCREDFAAKVIDWRGLYKAAGA